MVKKKRLIFDLLDVMFDRDSLSFIFFLLKSKVSQSSFLAIVFKF